MKTVFSNAMVAHVWAQQTQAEGRSGSMFFEHRTIYSYGHHYPIAEFRTTPNGDSVVMFNATQSSVTTERHKTIVRRAISGGTLITLPGDCWDDSERALSYYLTLQIRASEKARRARRWTGSHLQTMDNAAANAREYARLYNLPEPEAFRPSDIEAMRERAARQFETRVARPYKAKSAIERLRDTHAGYVRWRAGKRKECPSPWSNAMRTHRLTYHEADDTVYTSGGASFPGDHARRAALPLLAALDRGAEVNQTLRLGHFSIDAIGDTIKAGCHRVTRREARRMVRRLIGA